MMTRIDWNVPARRRGNSSAGFWMNDHRGDGSMNDPEIRGLSDCGEFAQTLAARPPRIVRGTLYLLVGLLGSGLGWAGTTTTELIVQAPCRVRPITSPLKVFTAVSGETLTTFVGGRVIEVNAREGDHVRAGDILLRLDTE